jgi:hypothetical protein
MKIPKTMINQAELARLWGVTSAAIIRMRKMEGLPFFVAGKKVYYDREEAEAWYRDHRLLKRGDLEAEVSKTA